MWALMLALLPVALPVVFWAGYHYHADRHLPEPIGHLALAFILGIGSYYLGMGLYMSLEYVHLRHDAFLLAQSNLTGLLTYSVLAIGLIEESVKIIPFLLVVIRFKEFDEPIDGIIYASFIALGFSAVENLHYLQFVSEVEARLRGFAGPVVHIVFASVWGYHIGRAHLRGAPLLLISIAMLLITAVLHGIYDFIVIGLPPSALPLSALIVASLWIWRLRLIRDLHTRYAESARS